ncbi:MAG TPA: adenylate/guanylate cyclase domain-containing protein [Gaiellaceae bacterium]|nr:adenylate/guanylate cyclase domain-containing protein [Gaiellaceae bacterium]
MHCHSCGSENRDGAKFCAKCGLAVGLACSSCGAAHEVGDLFCAECGTVLTAAAPAPAAERVAPNAERRLVSVLFADLVGFTTLSESRDPEEVRELLSRYFDVCRRLIGLYGGTVEKFIGDAVMAVWGAPAATEDDAERAVRAGLDLVAAVSALGQERGTEGLRARVGVLTGEAAVTPGADGQGMVAGDLVNTASRIQSVAEPSQVLVGEATRRASERAIVYAAAGTYELKGKLEPVELWRAVRIISGRQGAQRSVGLEPPFVGRDRELRLVKELFHASAEERKAHLVSVTGIAGIGKSRLVWEFYKYFDGLADNVYWHRGRCLAYGDGVTYWALADMVRMRARIAEDEEPASALAKLQATLSETILDADERSFVEPRIAQLLGLADAVAGDRADLFAAWRLFFERLADTYPTVLVFEDLQWADTSLLDFIEYLLEWSRSSSLLVVTLARPELAERRAGWGTGLRSFTSIYLEPLGQTAMSDLLAGLVPGLPDSLRDQILARAEGVPLYAVETVRMLLDRGLLTADGSSYAVTGEITALEVPETLHGLIAARLDGLPIEERRLLQDAAVVGKTFTRSAAAAVAGLAEEDLDPLLASLVRKEVLSLQADPRSPEHGQYGFLQDLVRHVAIETLSKRERRARHLAAAEHLQRAYPDDDEVVEVLASHYVDAYNAVRDVDDADLIRAKAYTTLERAGDRAESLGAPGEARRYLEQAAALADGAHERAKLLERAGVLAFGATDLDGAASLLADAISLYETEGDTHAAARVSGRLAAVERFQGLYDQAEARAEAAFAAVAADEPDADVADLALGVAAVGLFRGNLDRAAERLELALGVAEALGSAQLMARGFVLRSQLAAARSRPEESVAFLERGLAIALEHDQFEDASRLYFHLSDRAFHRDRYEVAHDHLLEALRLARRRGDRRGELATLAELTWPLHLLGRWDEALAQYEQISEENILTATTLSVLDGVIPIHLQRGELAEAQRILALFSSLESAADLQDRSSYLAGSSAVRLAEGRFEEARHLGIEADAVARAGFSASSQQSKQGLVAALAATLALGEPGPAEEILARIAALQPGLRPPYLEAQAFRFRGLLDSSEDSLTAAEAAFRALGTPFWIAVVLVEHSELLAREGREVEAKPLLAEARQTFERLRATPWLERVDAAASPTLVPGDALQTHQ